MILLLHVCCVFAAFLPHFDIMLRYMNVYLEKYDIMYDPSTQVKVFVVLHCVDKNDTVFIDYGCKEYSKKIEDSIFFTDACVKLHEFYITDAPDTNNEYKIATNNSTENNVDCCKHENTANRCGYMYERMQEFIFSGLRYRIAIGFFNENFYNERFTYNLYTLLHNSLYQDSIVCKVHTFYVVSDGQYKGLVFKSEEDISCTQNSNECQKHEEIGTNESDHDMHTISDDIIDNKEATDVNYINIVNEERKYTSFEADIAEIDGLSSGSDNVFTDSETEQNDNDKAYESDDKNTSREEREIYEKMTKELKEMFKTNKNNAANPEKQIEDKT